MFSKKIKGGALVEVLIAALVLSIGVIAFVKLMNVSVQRSHQTNYRIQAMASVNSAIEFLRANRGMINWLVNTGNNRIVTQANAVLGTNCVAGGGGDGTMVVVANSNTWCAPDGDAMRADLLSDLQVSFSNNFDNVPGKAVLCLRVENGVVAAGAIANVRVTVVWKNRSANVAGGYQVATLTDCPPDYAGALPAINGVNTQTPDRGFVEVYTSI